MTTLGTLLQWGREALAHQSPSADLDARWLLCQAADCSATDLFARGDRPVSEGVARQYREWVRRRGQGEPVAYLIGRRDFHGREFLVSPATLIPRPDTELLVDWLLELLPATVPQRVVDLGTGTGAVAITLALERPAWSLVGVDRFREVLDLAERNAGRLGADTVQWLQSDWCRALSGHFHAVVGNPPYIADRDPHLLQGDVRHEPRSALVAGEDGLDDVRTILSQAPGRLHTGGWLLLEHGHDQGEAVRELFRNAGLQQVSTRQDLGGRDRITAGRWEGEETC